MDALSSLLTGPRARGAFLLRSMMDPPWSLRIEDQAPLTVVVMVAGRAWLQHEDGEPVELPQGSAAVVVGPTPYRVADDPATAPQVIIKPGQRCETLDGADLHDQMCLGVRSWGNSDDPETIMLTGSYQYAGEVSRRLLEALPRLIVLPAEDQPEPLVSYLGAEIDREVPGQEAVLDRMLDLLVISVLRSWFASQHEQAPGWYRASEDPVIARVLAVIHDRPAEPWTVTDLAAEVGLSRAALARRFTGLVGESPMSYLTGWRLALAADLLHEPEATLEAIARRVGYGSAFALSTAFKRHHGVSPSDFRAQMSAAA